MVVTLSVFYCSDKFYLSVCGWMPRQHVNMSLFGLLLLPVGGCRYRSSEEKQTSSLIVYDQNEFSSLGSDENMAKCTTDLQKKACKIEGVRIQFGGRANLTSEKSNASC